MGKKNTKSDGSEAEEFGGRRIELMELENLLPAEKNPKQHDILEIKTSINRFGFVEPIVVDERTGRLVAGHGRLQALKTAKASGATPPAGVSEQNGVWMVPVVRGWASRSKTEAEAYLVASNGTTIAGGWNNTELAEMLSELSKLDALDGTGFGREDIDKILQAPPEVVEGTTDAFEEWQDMQEFGADKHVFRKIVVNFQDAASVAKFQKLINQEIPEKQRYIWFPEKKRDEVKSMEFVDGK